MIQKRSGLLKLSLEVFKTRFPFSIIGFVFIVMSVVALMTARFFSFTRDYFDNYDHAAIDAKGKDLKATVSTLQTQYNMTVNEDFHPLIITYTFQDNGQVKSDKFKTLTGPDKQVFKVGDTLNIKLYNGETMIKNLESYSFPYFMFYIIPLLLLLMGIPFLLMGLLPVLKKYQTMKAWV